MKPPTVGQKLVMSIKPKRVNVVSAPRRWGKTDLAVRLIRQAELAGLSTLYVASTYRLCESVKQDYGVTASATPETLPMGKQYNFIVVDEAALISRLKPLRAMLTENGRIWFISTPRPGSDFDNLVARTTGKRGTWIFEDV